MSVVDLKALKERNPNIARAAAVVALQNGAAALLRQFRSDSGLSQAALAEKLGVSQPRIAQLESGKPDNAPSLEQMADFAFQCGRTITISDAAAVVPTRREQELLRTVKAQAQHIKHLEQEVDLYHADAVDDGMVGPTFLKKVAANAALARALVAQARSTFTREQVVELANSIRTSVHGAKTDLHAVLTVLSKAVDRIKSR
jgi:transcriptional regulator with XRE-family HTH domain